MKNLILYFALFAFLVSCQKEINNVTTTDDKKEPIVFVTSSVFGVVKDENGTPLNNVLVEAGSGSASTDSKGNFNISNTIVRKNASIVIADEAGYFEGISSTRFSADGNSFAELILLDKGIPSKIVSSQDNSVISDGLEIRIDANSILKSDGSQFNGDAEVFSKYLDPTSAEFPSNMPGELISESENGEDQVLNTFAMMALDLETLAGEDLIISKDGETTIIMDIPEDLLGTAPEALIFYLFDVTEQKWVPCGKCKRVGGTYHCTYSNGNGGGYYCCADPIPSICLSGQVYNADSTTSNYIKVIVKDLTDNFIYYGYTDNEGKFCGAVPQAAFLQMTVVDHCGNEVYIDDLGPYAADTELGEIWLDIVIEEYIINLKGLVTNCGGLDMMVGHVALRIPGKLAILPYFSELNMNVGLNCVTFPEIEVQVFTDQEATSTVVQTFNQFGDIDLGTIETCQALDDKLIFDLDGESYYAAPTEFYKKENQTTNWYVLKAYTAFSAYTIELRDYQGIGTYNSNVFLSSNVAGPSFPYFKGSSPDIVLDIISDNGIFIEGTFSGILTDDLDVQHPISASFKIKKAP